MSRAEYRFNLSHPTFETNRAKWIMALVGLATYGFVLYSYFRNPESFRGGEILIWLNPLGFATLMLGHAVGVLPNFFYQYVAINLNRVEWRLPDPALDLVRRHVVPLARVREVEVAMLHIRFHLLDGTHADLPLGSLPYDEVQSIKARFTGGHSLAGVTGGAIRDRGSRNLAEVR